MNQEPNFEPNNESSYETGYESNGTPGPNRDEQIANTLCILSLACEVLPLIISGALIYIFSEINNGDTFNAVENVSTLTGIFHSFLSIVGLVLMIYVRVKYPKNFFGKFLMWLYIVAGVIITIITVLYMLFLMVACISCVSCLQDMPG